MGQRYLDPHAILAEETAIPVQFLTACTGAPNPPARPELGPELGIAINHVCCRAVTAAYLDGVGGACGTPGYWGSCKVYVSGLGKSGLLYSTDPGCVIRQ